jgi:hypothetical protein
LISAKRFVYGVRAMAEDPKSATEEPSTERRVPVATNEPIPTEQLMREQGITGPQGLDSLPFVPDWPEVD